MRSTWASNASKAGLRGLELLLLLLFTGLGLVAFCSGTERCVCTGEGVEWVDWAAGAGWAGWAGSVDWATGAGGTGWATGAGGSTIHGQTRSGLLIFTTLSCTWTFTTVPFWLVAMLRCSFCVSSSLSV